MIRYHLGALFSITVWGLSFVATKELLTVFHPSILALIRFLLSGSFLGIYCLLIGQSLTLRNLSAKAFLRFILLGLSGYSLYFWFENTGVGLTTAGNTALIIATIPLFTELVVSLRTRHFNMQLYLGLVLSLLGVYGLINGSIQWAGNEYLKGNLFVFIAVFCWVTYSFLIPPVVEKFGVLPTTFYANLAGIFTLLPLLNVTEALPDFTTFDGHVWGLLIFLSLICSLLAYLSWNRALHKLGEGITNIYIYFIPVVTLGGEYWFLGMPLEMNKLVSALFVITGVVISQSRAKSGR